ncbi:helix-turn-helix domain-containing protein [Brevibacillus brevis]|uniref:helix-turn-helix domain-containing protein n=1 Tax=Brevibacillus brevis TaxID=1393 RepID=UPI0025A63C9A|nr:helix-turn-helix domain-containing protein [Brevibacillus brevis]WJQ79834.1 helix-turn-helix domain-containing protein [Brevibacillus brevis]
MEKKAEKYPVVIDVCHIQQILGIGRRQAYELVNSGQFHVVRVGKRIKISRNIFFDWLEGVDKKKEIV